MNVEYTFKELTEKEKIKVVSELTSGYEDMGEFNLLIANDEYNYDLEISNFTK